MNKAMESLMLVVLFVSVIVVFVGGFVFDLI